MRRRPGANVELVKGLGGVQVIDQARSDGSPDVERGRAPACGVAIDSLYRCWYSVVSVKPTVSATSPLADAAEAQDKSTSGVERGKLVLSAP